VKESYDEYLTRLCQSKKAVETKSTSSLLLNITSSVFDKVKLASQSAIANVKGTTKKATEIGSRVVKGNQEEIERQKARKELKI